MNNICLLENCAFILKFYATSKNNYNFFNSDFKQIESEPVRMGRKDQEELEIFASFHLQSKCSANLSTLYIFSQI